MNIQASFRKVGLVFFMFLGCKGFAYGDVLWIKGETQPKYGRLISRDDSGEILFRFQAPNDATELRVKDSEIRELVINFDVPRLERLSPNKPDEYRDYAEELVAQREDPIARELAIRLFLIAASSAENEHDSSLVESALSGLPELARTQSEQQAFEVLIYLYTPKDHIPVARSQTDRDPGGLKESGVGRGKLLQAIRYIRQEKPAKATEILLETAVSAELKRWDSICSVTEINQMLTAKPTLEQLAKLFALEMALRNREAPKRDQTTTGWAEQARLRAKGWTRLPTFDSVTEFDPRKSVYRDGEWVMPEKQ